MATLRCSVLALAVVSAAACGDGAGRAGTDAGGDAGIDAPFAPDPAVGHWSTDFAVAGLSGRFAASVNTGANAVAIAANGDVYVGGEFTDASGVPLQNIGVWSQGDWAPVGSGFDGTVVRLGFDGSGRLWAAVTEHANGVGSVWRLDGVWNEIGLANFPIADMVVLADGPVVVGAFSSMTPPGEKGLSTMGIARFRADHWEASTYATDGNVLAVAAAPGGFCIAGTFDHIAGGIDAHDAACYDDATTAWAPLGTGAPEGIRVLASAPDGTWYAGGEFDGGIAMLAGSAWGVFAGGTANSITFSSGVRTIAFRGTDVLIGGDFGTVGTEGTPAAGLARWSPVDGWSELAGGVTTDTALLVPAAVEDLAVAADGAVWIGGEFARVGDAFAFDIARASPADVPGPLVGPRPTLGIGGVVNALAVTYTQHLVAAGPIVYAGSTATSGVVELDGGAWSDLAGIGSFSTINVALVRADGSLVIGGSIALDSGVTSGVMVRTADGWTPLGAPINGTVDCLLEHDGALWAGGDLFDAGGVPLSNLARFDGSAWTNGGFFDTAVLALAVDRGDLVAGGAFTRVDGTPAQFLARRHGGGWNAFAPPLGTGMDVVVTALASSPTLGLVVGGHFTFGSGLPIANVARLDDMGWHQLGDGLTVGTLANGVLSPVTQLVPYAQGVFASGSFSVPDDPGGVSPLPQIRVAWFDGAKWHALGTGVNSQARAIAVIGRTLYVGGSFRAAGGRSSMQIGAWEF